VTGLRIVATAEVPAAARRAFERFGEIVVDPHGSRAEILIVRGTAVDAEMLSRLHGLRAIARTGAGYDNLDVDAATARRIPILYTPGVGSQPIAEGTVALLLAAAKRLRELGAVVRDGRWNARYDTAPLDIEGACLGVIGFGAIGQRVARLCRGLGMEVIAYDPAVDPFADVQVELVQLEDLLERADAISLHCELTDGTRGLVDRRLLAKVRPGAILVNVARGEIVESDDVLADALATGRLSAVALDVFVEEPPDPAHRLYADPRTICTPHAVGLTSGWSEQVFQSLARDLGALLAGEMPTHVLNPEAMIGRSEAGDRLPHPFA
jgi:D-3-phosphoglycerate dehydrogenase / 2-oxoglutarate reductase